MARLMARMWASVNTPFNAEPRWTLVPELTIWFASSRSRCRSKWSCSGLTGSINVSLQAGLPASGETLEIVGVGVKVDMIMSTTYISFCSLSCVSPEFAFSAKPVIHVEARTAPTLKVDFVGSLRDFIGRRGGMGD